MTSKLEANALDIEDCLDIAEREHVLDGKTEFFFPLRKKRGFDDFYVRLEHELREQDLFLVVEYRTVKEGWVNLSRPSVLRMDLPSLLRRRPHLASLALEFAKWRSEFQTLRAEAMIRENYLDVIAEPSLTHACFHVLDYLLANGEAVRGLLPRQIRHASSTKLIGREPLLLRMFGVWRGESATWSEFYRYFELADKPVEFRFYAPSCRFEGAALECFHGLLAADWAESYDFSGSSGTLIVENLETFYSEVARGGSRLLLWGGGWKASLLLSVQARFPRPLFYWGDIDKEGYEIYGYLKGHIPELQARGMDRETISRHVHLAIAKELFFGPFRSAADLQAEYQDICQRGLCIEQEKVHLSDVEIS